MDSFERQWQRWFPEERDKEPTPPAPGGWTTARVFLVLVGALALFILISVLKGFYTEWLWFSSLGYGDVYATILRAKVIIFFSAAIIFCLLFLGNLLLATRLAPKTESHFWPWAIVRRLQSILRLNVILGTALLALIFGMVAQGNWLVVLRFFNRQSFGIVDPVFYRDVGFYVFSLPFLHLLQGWLVGALIITLIASAGVYFLSYAMQRLKFDFTRPVLAHIGGLFIVISGLFAWGYWLGIWELVFSERGVVFGASYADMHARLPAQWMLIAVMVILSAIILVSISRRNYRLPLYGIAGWIAVAILAAGIYPALVRRFQVEPNELVRETPYIEYNIQFTREAFALNRVEEQPFPAEDTLTSQDIAQNEMTINNIRLWDHRPLKDTYNQIQSFRLYYDLDNIDSDRYIIDGEYRQVMLSARELSAEKLAGQAQTWVNRKLQFTHGYGVVLSPVNEVTTQGLPNLFLKDIPPVGKFTIERPQIYFGEKTNDYVIVKAKTQEFDYPSGDENVYGRYEGKDGISLDGFLRRLAYAWQLGDFNILISSELNPESRVLYYRNIGERVNHLAPFLELDDDPYLVVFAGRLLWIQDAYTTSDRFPYSEPLGGGLNYIRNSAKAVIDAYDGTVTFYITEPEDALLRTYQAIFPGLFVPIEQMPESLRVHLRYPLDLFNIQAAVYQTYHMENARVFYNKEDLWTIPRELYFGREQSLEPYYITMRLPEGEKEEFLLMLPFTPVNKNNTIGWLAARSDGENYGKLLAYLFSKERLVYGPSQIENRIGQDTTITEQLALWSRGGSRVIRGNLLLIPLGKSILYVEPVFLQAEDGGLPELKRVIVAAGEQIAMAPTLKESLKAIFGTEAPPTAPVVTPPAPRAPEKPIATDIANLIDQAQQHYNQAQQYLKAGDWAGYGKELEALKAVLNKLAELATEEKR
ncbi:MAG: UPF0182 family protein [Chloroflexi bacterium]|nr:UPF0182 family protein [Chloroflexota bacterium]MBI3931195.1 UPF0182 family protein [Chloroflexota bacterium]